MHAFVTVPERPPYNCIRCTGGASDDRDWFLDLGEVAGDEGVDSTTVYVCKLCLVAMCQEQGIVEQGPLLARISRLEDDLFEARRKADGLGQVFSGLFLARVIAPDDPRAGDLSGLLEDPPAGLEPARDGASGLADEGGEPPEPGDGQDLGGLRASLSIHGGARG